MKSSDKIKKGLECCMDYQNCTEGEDPQCPYYDVKRCMEALLADALALIQQLQAENAEQAERIQQLEKRVIHLEALNQSNLSVITMQERTRGRLQEQISQLEAERDALYEEVRRCFYCIHVDGVLGECNQCCESCEADCPCKECDHYSKFEWRGVQKEE